MCSERAARNVRSIKSPLTAGCRFAGDRLAGVRAFRASTIRVGAARKSIFAQRQEWGDSELSPELNRAKRDEPTPDLLIVPRKRSRRPGLAESRRPRDQSASWQTSTIVRIAANARALARATVDFNASRPYRKKGSFLLCETTIKGSFLFLTHPSRADTLF